MKPIISSTSGRTRLAVGLAAALALGSYGASAASARTAGSTEPTEPSEASDDTSAGADAPAGSGAVEFDEAWCEPLAEPFEVTVSAGLSTAYGSHYMALALGYYDEENITVTDAQLNEAADAFPLLAAGQIDVAASGYSAPTFNAIHEGLDLTGTISMGLYDPENPPGAIFVRNELIDSGEVTEPGDLAGMRFGLTNPNGSSLQYIAGNWLEQAGISYDEITVVDMPRETIPQALMEGSIDFAYVPSSIRSIVDEDGAAQPFGEPGWIANNGQDTLITLLMNELLLDNRDVARAIVRANLRSRQALQGDYREDTEVVDALAGALDWDTAQITDTEPFLWIPDGAVNADTIERMQQFYIDQGQLVYDEPIPFDELVDDSVRQEALATLENCDAWADEWAAATGGATGDSAATDDSAATGHSAASGSAP